MYVWGLWSGQHGVTMIGRDGHLATCLTDSHITQLYWERRKELEGQKGGKIGKKGKKGGRKGWRRKGRGRGEGKHQSPEDPGNPDSPETNSD